MGTHLAAPFANFQNSLILRERSDMSEDKVFIPEIVEDGSSFDKEKQGPKTKVKIGCAAVGLSYFILMVKNLFDWCCFNSFCNLHYLIRRKSIFSP